MTSNTLGEFSDLINEEEMIGYDNDENEIQTGRGEKRKNESDQESESEDGQSEDEQGQYYYSIGKQKEIPFEETRDDSHRSPCTI